MTLVESAATHSLSALIEAPTHRPFEEVVPSSNLVMGVKAIWGIGGTRVQCFGARGTGNDRNRYMIPRAVAMRAREQPFVITIGGGAEARAEVDGRVMEVMKVSNLFGETNAFVTDPEARKRLSQWPVAVAVHDVWAIDARPDLVKDLGLPDRSILANAFDTVIRHPQVDTLWERLKGYWLTLKDLPPIPHFRAPDNPRQVNTFLPWKVPKEEGKRLLTESVKLERSAYFSKLAKEKNREENGGNYRCEACRFSADQSALFDAHHLVPLALGQRLTVPSDFAVLCPTCHRIAHWQAVARHNPLTVDEVSAWIEARGPKRTHV